ncbi:MAG: fluoride efflux transporter CrcB [Planctomycetia bacterium]|nr:fluoride efflux transporter CrcB [Planctomycetia bacterium]
MHQNIYSFLESKWLAPGWAGLFQRGTLPGMTLPHIVWLAAAGALGTLLRVACHGCAGWLFGHALPWGTLVVNVAGSFAFGAIAGWFRARGTLPGGLEAILLVGLLGGFTTYSSYAFQSLELFEHGRPAAAIGYVVATNVLAIGAAWAGLRLFGA